MNFNPQDFSIKDVIQDRVQKEADIEWANLPNNEPNLSKFTPCDPLKPSAGLWNFLRQLRP